MMYDERIKRLEGYREQCEALQRQIADDFHMGKDYGSYFDEDSYIAREIFDELSGILGTINSGIWDIKKGAAGTWS